MSTRAVNDTRIVLGNLKMFAHSTSSSSEGGIIEWAAASRPLPGQDVSGDALVVHNGDTVDMVAVIDALGHGPVAHQAAQIIVDQMQTSVGLPSLADIFMSCHDAARHTRGAVMSAAWLWRERREITWLGVGNVDGVVVRASAPAATAKLRLTTSGGVVGYRLPNLRATTLTMHPGDLVAFATDGLHAAFADELRAEPDLSLLVDRLLRRHGKANDDALIWVGRYLGGMS